MGVFSEKILFRPERLKVNVKHEKYIHAYIKSKIIWISRWNHGGMQNCQLDPLKPPGGYSQ